jgi:hypothetical protein
MRSAYAGRDDGGGKLARGDGWRAGSRGRLVGVLTKRWGMRLCLASTKCITGKVQVLWERNVALEILVTDAVS